MHFSFNELLEKHLTESLSAEEKQAFLNMLEDENNLRSLEDAIDRYASAKSLLGAEDQRLKMLSFERLQNNVRNTTDVNVATATPVIPMHGNRFVKKTWWRYAAAVIIAVGVGAYLWTTTQNKQEPATAQAINDILPGREGAILTLADGERIVVDGLGDGVVAIQSGTKISLQNGQLEYNVTSADAVSFNTMTTPRGRQFNIQLPDGSKAWLNAASSITYPTAFIGAERSVQITGEVYFEIAKDAKKPFKVKLNDKTEVEVLGTSFNVKAYSNEPTINTTLLEGAVRVKSHNNLQLLTPGQQTRIKPDGNISLIKKADIEKIMAWKNGLFNFENAQLAEVMKQLERWYDIKVIYPNGVPDTEFVGKMSRNISLNDVLAVLEKMGVKFKLEEGHRLIIMP